VTEKGSGVDQNVPASSQVIYATHAMQAQMTAKDMRRAADSARARAEWEEQQRAEGQYAQRVQQALAAELRGASQAGRRGTCL
jgi:hypothetical protein